MIEKVHKKKENSPASVSLSLDIITYLFFSQEPGGAVSPGSVTTKFSPCVLTTDSSSTLHDYYQLPNLQRSAEGIKSLRCRVHPVPAGASVPSAQQLSSSITYKIHTVNTHMYRYTIH